MKFGIFSFVIFFAILQRKFCDAIPTVTLTGKNTFYVGDNLQLSCAVDQDVDLLSVSFFKGITETIWISDPTSCKFFKMVPEDTSTYNTTCNSLKTNFTMIKYDLNASDDKTVWSCQIKSTPGGNGSCVGTNNPCASRSIILFLQVPSNVSNSTDDCPLEVVLGYGLGDGLCSDTICIICLILIVIWVKTVVNIQDKKKLQKPKLKGKDVTITASVYGVGISGVHWTGPQGNTLTSEKYNIQYDKNEGTSTLKIKDLQIIDSGLYTCHAEYGYESSAQDSVIITVYEKLAVYIDIGETFRQHGSDVNIICSVYGSENKIVNWTGQEENQLTDGGRYTITPYDSNTNESSLSIRNSSKTKAEGYICQVLLKESEVSVKMYIRIRVLDNGLLGDIWKIILSVPASENESRKWIGPQDNILTDTEKYAIVPYDSKTNKSHLTIKNIYKNGHGFYTYQAVDSSGSPQKISITITTNDSTDSMHGASKLILRLCFGIIFVACIACIVVILVTKGSQCVLKLGLGLGLGLGIPCVGCIIVIVILVKKDVKILAKDELQKPILEGSEVTIPAFLHGFFISSVQWIGPDGNILTSNGKSNKKYNRDTGISTLQISALERKDSGFYTCRAIGIFGTSAKDSIRISVDDGKSPTASGNRKSKSGSRSDVSRNDVEIQMEEKGVMSNEARPPATENKVKSETTSMKTNGRPQPLPPVTIVTKDIPKPRPQPPPPVNSDDENRNLRGISANFDDSRGLPTDIPQSGRLPPLPQKQPTVQEEDASEKPRQKKNKKKKKGKVKEGSPEEEMVELKSKRNLPEDQSDED